MCWTTYIESYVEPAIVKNRKAHVPPNTTSCSKWTRGKGDAWKAYLAVRALFLTKECLQIAQRWKYTSKGKTDEVEETLNKTVFYINHLVTAGCKSVRQAVDARSSRKHGFHASWCLRTTPLSILRNISTSLPDCVSKVKCELKRLIAFDKQKPDDEIKFDFLKLPLKLCIKI